MSNDNQPKQRRSFRIVFKVIKFAVAMILTFCISFAVTLVMKSDDPTEIFGSYVEDVPAEDNRPTGTAPEIKTLFDEQNQQAFSPSKYAEGTKDNLPAAEVPAEKSPPQPAREESELGFFDTLSRMSSVKPAVDEKLKTIPHYVPLKDMPKILGQAIIAVEDNRFYSHRGFDILSIARSVLVNVEAGEIQEGASTITQQTVKNLFLTNDRTFTRKAEELVLSMNMEKDFDKDKILEIYLNAIYFGSNYYGIYDAAQGYFGKAPIDLTIAECAMLAGLPNAPSLDSPYVDFRRAKKRQLVVIDAMEKAGIISTREAENARIEEIILAH